MTPEERGSKFCQSIRHNWEPGVYSSRCNCDAVADEIRAAVEEEREACALIVHDSDGLTFAQVEAAIRARGKS